jgi:hypothetical protein
MATAPTPPPAPPTPVTDVATIARLDRMIHQLNNMSTSDVSLAPKPFTGSPADIEQVTMWLHYFDNYVIYRFLDKQAELNLFKLMLKDLAADWLQQLPESITRDVSNLRRAFEERFALNPVQRLQRATSMWHRDQGATETVDDYVNAMRKLARQGAMFDEQQLVYAIVRGLKAKIRLQVLNSGADNIARVLDAAKRAEAALALAPVNTDQSLNDINKKIDLFMQKFDAMSAKQPDLSTTVSNKTASESVNAVTNGRRDADYGRRTSRSYAPRQFHSTFWTKKACMQYKGK